MPKTCFLFYVVSLDSEPVNVKTTPVGPVAGGIMGIFLVLALSVYCYRHHVHRTSHQYVTSLPENQARMSHYYYETEEPEPHEEIGTGKSFFLSIFFIPGVTPNVSMFEINFLCIAL